MVKAGMRKRTASLVLVLALCCGWFAALAMTLPMGARALATQSIPAGGNIGTPGLYDISATTEPLLTITANGVALTGTNGALTVVVEAGITLTLMDAHITGNSTQLTGIYLGGMNCQLVLTGENSVTGVERGAGVCVPGLASVTIVGPGKLTATGGGLGGAGIGSSAGNPGQPSGAITIAHAVVFAYGGGAGSGSSGGAGIGGGGAVSGGAGGLGSDISIQNAVVFAQGGVGEAFPIGGGGGAGIGGGGSLQAGGGTGQNISIDAASLVQAVGGAGGAGTISAIYDGGGGGGAAVGGGGGGGDSYNGGAANNITIASGQLAADSAGGAAGSGVHANCDGGAGALCGSGGQGGYGGDPTIPKPPAIGANGTELGGVTATGPAIGPASRTDPTRPGYPALPSVTAPADKTVNIGGDASFAVVAAGGDNTAYYYQWQLSTDSGATWVDIDPAANASAATASLALSNVLPASYGNQYRCVVYDFVFRSATSSAATLTANAATSPTPEPAPDPGPGSPQTGDASNLPLWALCGTLSLLGLALCGVVLRKRFGRNAG